MGEAVEEVLQESADIAWLLGGEWHWASACVRLFLLLTALGKAFLFLMCRPRSRPVLRHAKGACCTRRLRSLCEVLKPRAAWLDGHAF